MTINPFKPPDARLDPGLAASSVPTVTWIARALGAILVVVSIGKMIWLIVQGTQTGLGAGAVYAICLIPVPTAIAGALVFMRSRLGMVACIVATVLRLLLAPWLQHLVRVWLHVPDDAFDYGQALSRSLHPPSAWWLLDVAVIGFCIWDHRRRFAAWRMEAPLRESPPVESA